MKLKKPVRRELESWPVNCLPGERGLYLSLLADPAGDAVLDLRYYAWSATRGKLLGTQHGVTLGGAYLAGLEGAIAVAREIARAEGLVWGAPEASTPAGGDT